jgi:hypothetical protein
LASPAGNVGGITQALWEALHGGKVIPGVLSVPNSPKFKWDDDDQEDVENNPGSDRG